jgi:membrane protein
MRRSKALFTAIYRVYEQSGFSMAGAVAFSLLISLFPFFIFLGALASVLGGRDLATSAADLLFQYLPAAVAVALAGEVDAVVGHSRVDLLTVSAVASLFFATSAIETLRAALNAAYRVTERRPYILSLVISMLFVLATAIVALVITWGIVVGPTVAQKLKPRQLGLLLDSSWFSMTIRYLIAVVVVGLQLFAYHLWLAAGRRRIADVWPGVLLSMVLYVALAAGYSYYLDLSDYTRFYAGLSQLMVALIFFQLTAIVVLLGAELNRGIMELRRNGTEHAPMNPAFGRPA